jgi:hypothetical protein
MAQYMNIGPHEKNQSGHTSKGYGIRRIGKKTVHVWGPIESVESRTKNHFRWKSKDGTPERSEVKTHATVADAKEHIEKVKRLKRYHGYKPLKTGDRIR